MNDTIIHLATPYMGFGGFGESGMGSYHGKAGFETFSHHKSIVDKKNWPGSADAVSAVYGGEAAAGANIFEVNSADISYLKNNYIYTRNKLSSIYST